MSDTVSFTNSWNKDSYYIHLSTDALLITVKYNIIFITMPTAVSQHGPLMTSAGFMGGGVASESLTNREKLAWYSFQAQMEAFLMDFSSSS